MTEIVQYDIPYDPTDENPLPGIRPADPEAWLHMDDAYARQMGRRDDLLAHHSAEVLAMDPSALLPAQELLEVVLGQMYPGVSGRVVRPDGVEIAIDVDKPLKTLGHLVQEDFCILEKRGDEHVLTGAVLCFPASWKLSEKFMRPLVGIHETVESYDDNIARRVQRLFDGIQPGRPLWRFNALWYRDAELFQPRSVHERREPTNEEAAAFLRSERQTLLRLPRTRAVVFAIHTYVLPAQVVQKWKTPPDGGAS